MSDNIVIPTAQTWLSDDKIVVAYMTQAPFADKPKRELTVWYEQNERLIMSHDLIDWITYGRLTRTKGIKYINEVTNKCLNPISNATTKDVNKGISEINKAGG